MLEEGFLKVSNIHSISYSTYGNKNGKPLLFVHGGPGSSSNLEKNLYNIDLNKFYVILFDQRGAGKSLPSGELKENETSFLIEDMKKLLDFLSIKKTIIYGGSWGSFLSLAFAVNHPSYVEKIFLRSSYIANYKDSDWFWNSSKIFMPDMYEKFMTPLLKNKKEDENAQKYMFEYFINADLEEKKYITALFDNYNFCLSNLVFSNKDFEKPEEIKEKDINSTKIFLHYEKDYSFIEDNYILNNIDKIKNIPITFYHGRYDMICTFDAVYEVYKKLNKAELKIIPYEGHSGSMIKELIIAEINAY